jgi:hypothetical protein
MFTRSTISAAKTIDFVFWDEPIPWTLNLLDMGILLSAFGPHGFSNSKHLVVFVDVSGQLFSNNQKHIYYSETSNNAYITCICYNSVLSLNLPTSSADNNCLTRTKLFFIVQKPNRKQRHIKGVRWGHGNQRSPCPHSTPQTLIVEPIT